MQKRRQATALALGLGFALAALPAAAEGLSNYTVNELLNPCFESDNDARWGAAAETECEQYLRGFTDALILTGATGTEICLPELNRDDEVRWAYMRWVHENFDARKQPAAEGLMATLKDKFPCN